MKVLVLPLGCALVLCAQIASAQTTLLKYSFTGDSPAPTFSDASVTGSNFSSADVGNPSNTSPVSSGYTDASGGHYFTDNSWTGDAPGTNYFSFTMTPADGVSLSLSSISFGYRRTNDTSPTTFTIRSSSDGFTGDLATGTLLGDATWQSSGLQAINLAFGTATEFRIYANGAVDGSRTLRIDDVTVAGSAIPEPSTYAAFAGLASLAGAIWWRRKRGSTSPN